MELFTSENIIPGLCGSVGTVLLLWVKSRLSQSEIRKQQELEIRKNIYFEAYEAAATIQSTLMLFVNEDLSKLNIDPKLSATLSRLHAIANIEIIQETIYFQNYISESIFKIIPHRLSIDAIQGKIKHAQDMSDLYLEQQSEWSKKLDTLPSETDIQKINDFLDDRREKITTCQEYILKETPNLNNLRIELLNIFLECTVEGLDKLKQFNILIRKELGFPFSSKDEITYNNLIQKMQETAKTKINDYMANIESFIQKEDASFPSL